MRLVSITARNPSAETSQNPCGCVMKTGLTAIIPRPALLTSMSRPPSRDHACSTARATQTSSRASAAIPIAFGNWAAMAAARSADLLVSTTVAPARASALAIAWPSPLVPPVTSTRVPVRSISCSPAICPAEPFWFATISPR